MSNDTTNCTNITANQSDTFTSDHIQNFALAAVLTVVIVVVIAGNTLVILAVITTRRLRTVTNCFVMSLAIADWLVGTFVMPPAVAYAITETWELGWFLCDVWVSLDILLCTASILSLCAISVDRYLAVTQPLSYSRKRRSKRLAFSMILVVWISSILITCPPMFGWYESGRNDPKTKTCRYNQNTGYVIFSAMGSFFIPMVVMLYVYVRISCVIAQRHDQLAHIDSNARRNTQLVPNVRDESDLDRGSSECDDHHQRCTNNQSSDHDNNDQKRPLDARIKPTLSFSYKHEPLTPQRSVSLYRTPTASQHCARPESLTLDASILNFEPATRVSSFRRETKTAQTLSIVMGGFIACWLPFFIFYLMLPFLDKTQTNKLILQYLTWLGWINSAINPFIYAFYSPDFRIAFWRLTVKHFSKNRRPDFAFQHK